MMARNKKKSGRGYTRDALVQLQERLTKLAERRANRNWQKICAPDKDLTVKETINPEQTGTIEHTSIQIGLVNTQEEQRITEEEKN